ncbi:MAG: MFS transporter [Acidimicrobiales bacterium]
MRAVRRQGPGKWLATKRPLVSGVSRALKRAAWYPYYLYPPLGAGTGLAPASPDGSPLPAGPRSLTGRLRAVAQRARSAERAPFFRLALVHGLSSAGDAIVAIALAGSIFFNVSVTAAQSKVALSLALTVAPFAIVGPLLGPLVERARGGRRAMAIFSAGGRATCCFLMAFWAHSLALFPVAFFTLVFSKLYLVTKAALVPGVVDRPDQLVLANSKLSVGGSVAGVAAGGVGAALLSLFNSPWVLRFDVAVYLACAWGATQLRAASGSPAAVPVAPLGLPAEPPPLRPAPPPPGLPPGGLQLAAVATAGLRAVTGFVIFLLVFTFRRDEAALIWYGLALGASQVGNVAGALLAPRFRRYVAEEWMLTGSSAVVGVVALSAGLISWGRHWTVAVFLAAAIGLAAGSGKLAFDSMVQRDVPSRVRGRSFARFESGFQLAWAIGGLLAVLVPMALSTGFVTIGAIGLFGALAFARGSVSARRGTLPAWWPGSAPRPSAVKPAENGQRHLP